MSRRPLTEKKFETVVEDLSELEPFSSSSSDTYVPSEADKSDDSEDFMGNKFQKLR